MYARSLSPLPHVRPTQDMASIWTARTRFLLLIVVVMLTANVGRQLYRWLAYGEERDELRRVTVQLDSAALNVMRTQLLAGTLRDSIASIDARLEADRRTLAGIERRADGNGLPPALYEQYRRRREAYNTRVEVRNEQYDRWRGVVDRNHTAVNSYNALADSMRNLGDRMGEPYLAIPSPAEVAVRYGLEVAP